MAGLIKKIVLILLLLFLAGCTVALGSSPTPPPTAHPATPTPSPTPLPPANIVKIPNIPYRQLEGVNANTTSLDIYITGEKGASKPVMVYIHGGGWSGGDKGEVANLPQAFIRQGFILVSTNYRLNQDAHFPAHAEDTAAAIGWVVKNISPYGGDPNRLFLMGHSAGAHLAALVATDERYLLKEGLSLKNIRGVVSLDTGALDLPALAVQFGGELPEPYASTFGQDPAAWKAASPFTYIAPGKDIPPMVVPHTGGHILKGNPNRAFFAMEFVDKLQAAGIRAEVVSAPELNHSEIIAVFGTRLDQVAPEVFIFLRSILADLPPSS